MRPSIFASAGSATSADYTGTTGAVELTGSNSTAEISIAIVDDIVTTGHTANELARQLKINGAGKISLWSCALASGKH